MVRAAWSVWVLPQAGSPATSTANTGHRSGRLVSQQKVSEVLETQNRPCLPSLISTVTPGPAAPSTALCSVSLLSARWQKKSQTAYFTTY